TELLRASSEPRPIISLQDLHQPFDPLVGIRIAGLERLYLTLQRIRARHLRSHGADHGLQLVHVIREGKIVGAHGIGYSTSWPAMPQDIHAQRAVDSLCRSRIIQQIQVFLPPWDAPASSPDHPQAP